jgi:hypothetical protein
MITAGLLEAPFASPFAHALQRVARDFPLREYVRKLSASPSLSRRLPFLPSAMQRPKTGR